MANISRLQIYRKTRFTGFCSSKLQCKKPLEKASYYLANADTDNTKTFFFNIINLVGKYLKQGRFIYQRDQVFHYECICWTKLQLFLLFFLSLTPVVLHVSRFLLCIFRFWFLLSFVVVVVVVVSLLFQTRLTTDDAFL